MEHNSKKTNQLKKWLFKSGPFIQEVVWNETTKMQYLYVTN